MRRLQQQVSAADCNKILTEEKRAALSVVGDDGYPYTVPVNFFTTKQIGSYTYTALAKGIKPMLFDGVIKCV